MPVRPTVRRTIDWERLRPRFMELRLQGLTDNAIARELNVNEDSLHGWVWRSKLSRPRRVRMDGTEAKPVNGPRDTPVTVRVQRLQDERRTLGNRFDLGLVRRGTKAIDEVVAPTYPPYRTATAALMGDPRPGRTPWA